MAARVPDEFYAGRGWMIRAEPALFYRTVGLQVERMLNDNLSVGANFLFKFGNGERRVVSGQPFTENYNKSSALLEFAAKYYLGDNAPEGIYLQAHIGFGNLINEDGTFRTLALNTDVPKPDGARRVPVPDPSIVRYGLGAGYQGIIVSRGICVNLMGGLQFQTDNKGFKTNIFISPSAGFAF